MERTHPRSIPCKIVAVYAVVSALWIYFSDSLLALMVDDARLMSRFAMLKGFLFVLVTSLLLWVLIRRYVHQLKAYNVILLESERRFREMMERVHTIAIILDEKGHIVFCNDYLLQVTGWTRDEVIGQSWIDLFIPSSQRAQVSEIFFSGMAAGHVVDHYENTILTRDGSERLIVWDNTVLLSGTGTVTGTASLGIDVTDHRNLEMQLLQTQKMESIGTLAGGVAHDFNNILTVIMSCASMLRMRKDDPARSAELIGQIESAAHRAANLTSSLLAFSRKQPIIAAPVNLNEMIESMRLFLERIIGEDLVLQIEFSPIAPFVLADRSKLEQVVMNLVGNARDAMPDGGILLIRTGIVALDNFTPEGGAVVTGDFALLTIADTGAGISAMDQKRVFEPFFTTKEIGKGTGLGLSMAYGIIKQHSGWITLDTELGKGSSFSIHLPLVEQHETCPQQADQHEFGGKGRILLVEDDEQVLQANSMILELAGFEVLPARTGLEALEAYSTVIRTIDVAVLDVVMPGMNGRELYDRLVPLNPALRVLFTSGYTADILDRKDLPQGCLFLQKPHSPAEFLKTVGSMIESTDRAIRA